MSHQFKLSVQAIWYFSLLCAVFSLPAHAVTVTLPMERTTYFIGESIPVAVLAPTPYQFALVDNANRSALAGTCTESNLRLPTQRLAPGLYNIVVDGTDSGVSVRLVTPTRASNAALTDEAMPDISSPEKRAAAITALEGSGINVTIEEGAAEFTRDARLDVLAQTSTMALYNPYTRPLSFFPARVFAPELQSFRHRLALSAQANSRYPNFGGYQYDWDPTGFVGNRLGLFVYWQWGDHSQALRNYIASADQAVYDDFAKRTGLKAPTLREYIQYSLSIGRPEYAPAIDLPTYRWLQALEKTYTPLKENDRMRLERRLDAWSTYLMGLYAESYTGHNAVLRDVIPSLRNTSSVNLGHNAVRTGQYHPGAYQPLDFRYLTAWDDQVGSPDYSYQWLYGAALLDSTRPHEQPTWIGSSLGTVHGLADYPGRFMRMAGHNLAYGGRGLGFSLEGFSTILGGMNTDTQWANIQGTAAQEDLVSGREFLKRFAPLSAACSEVRQVGLLYSRSQYARQQAMTGPESTTFKTFITLARLGYTPRYVTEEQILTDGLKGMRALVVAGQSVPLPWRVMAKLQSFVDGGGKIYVDKDCMLDLPEARVIDIAFDTNIAGKPFNWQVPNEMVTGKNNAVVIEEDFARLAPAMLRTLGDEMRTPLIPTAKTESRISTFALDGGQDATYVVAVNDAIQSNQSNWVSHRETLTPNGTVKGVLYDLTKEQALGPVRTTECVFDDVTVHVYGILNRPVSAINLWATQKINAGGSAAVSVRFVGNNGVPLRAAIPFYLTVTRPDGTLAQEYYRTTTQNGTFTLAVPVGVNDALGTWTLSVRSLLDGMTSTLPVTVEAGKPLAPEQITEKVVVRGSAAIKAFMAAKQKPTIVIPVFEGGQQQGILPAAEAARTELLKRGFTVEIVTNPPVVTYTMGYDPGPAELAENARAERGEAIGKITLTTLNRNDYFAASGGYIFGKPILLLDLVGKTDPTGKALSDNPMAEALDTAGMLWPKACTAFPGPGKATLQMVKSAFLLGVDAMIIQASDVDGLIAGARALANPPVDWITPSVEEARETLFTELGVGKSAGLSLISQLGMSMRGLKTGKAPQPLAMRFPEGKPPTAGEVKPLAIPVPGKTLPASYEPKEFVPYYNVSGRFEPCWTPGGNLIGDTRFNEALWMKVDAGAGGPYTIMMDGTFRYSDRTPRSQAQWEDILVLYTATITPVRKPMAVDVMIDGKIWGSLQPIAMAEREVPLETLPSYVKEKPKSTTEEVVTRLSGTVDLPAGTHELMLIYRNMVDGMIQQVTFSD